MRFPFHIKENAATSLACWCYVLAWLPTATLNPVEPVYHDCYGVNQMYCFTTPGRIGGTCNNFLKSYSDASNWCRERNLSLLTIENEAKHLAVREFMLEHEYNTDSVWLGGGALQNASKQWTWVDGTLYNGSLTPTTTPNAPEMPMGAFLNKNGVFADSSTERYGYVCQFQKSQCPLLQQKFDNNSRHAVAATSLGSNVHTMDNACYIAFPLDNVRATKTWFDARSVCLYHGGDLATDITPFANNMDKLLGSAQQTNYWIGLQQKPLVWFDESGQHEIVRYTAFPYSPPTSSDQLCLVLQLESRHSTFGFYNCTNEQFLFICDDEKASPPTKQPTNDIPVSIIVGIVVGCVSLVAGFVIGYCFRKHYRCKAAKTDADKPVIPLPSPRTACQSTQPEEFDGADARARRLNDILIQSIRPTDNVSYVNFDSTRTDSDCGVSNYSSSERNDGIVIYVNGNTASNESVNDSCYYTDIASSVVSLESNDLHTYSDVVGLW